MMVVKEVSDHELQMSPKYLRVTMRVKVGEALVGRDMGNDQWAKGGYLGRKETEGPSGLC